MLHVLHAMNENLAAQGEVFKSLSQSVRSMDGRIDTLEGAPGSRWSAVTGCTVAALGGLVLGWIARLL